MSRYCQGDVVADGSIIVNHGEYQDRCGKCGAPWPIDPWPNGLGGRIRSEWKHEPWSEPSRWKCSCGHGRRAHEKMDGTGLGVCGAWNKAETEPCDCDKFRPIGAMS